MSKNRIMQSILLLSISILMITLLTTLTAAAAPIISNPAPFNNEMAIPLNNTLTITVIDPDVNFMNITFSYYNNSKWTNISSQKNKPDGNYSASGKGIFIEGYKQYTWKVTVEDSNGEFSERIFNFTTRGLLKPKWVADVGSNPIGDKQILPVMGDIDNDGIQEIVFATNNSVIALNGETGQIKWRVPEARGSAVELADLNNDGIPEVLVGLEGPRVRAINGNGSIRWTSQKLKGEGQSLQPLLAYDTDGDGYPIIYFSSQDDQPSPYSGNMSDYTGALSILDHNGKLLNDTWIQKPCWGGFALGDVNFDGNFELFMSDRRDGYHDVPGNGLQAYDANTLEMLWKRPDLQHSSPLPMLANVLGDDKLEVIATQITLRGPLVLDPTNGQSILDYQNRGLPTHAQGTVYDIDNDGHLEIIMGTSYPDSAPTNFVVFDLITGQIEFSPTFDYHTTWPPKVGDVTGDGKMEIVAAMGNQGWASDYPLLVYNNNYQLIDRVDIKGAGQLSPARFFDIDGDGLNEVVVGSANGKILAFDTPGITPNPAPRTWTQEYSEYKLGAAEYVEPPGPKAPTIRSANPTDNAVNVSANPKITISIYDFQKDKFNVSFEIYQGFQWRQLAKFTNVANGNYSTNTSPYVTTPSTEYQWRVTLTDTKGNSKQYMYKFTTSNAINTTAPIVAEIYPLNHMGAVPINTTALVFQLNNSEPMTYNLTTVPNIGSAYRTNVSQGIHSVNISGLQNNMNYIWRLEVSDNQGVTYKEYYFSTPVNLNISINGNGVVTINPPIPVYNTEVNLTAVPDPGNTFLGWTGDYVGYDNPLTVLLDVPKSYNARFRQETGTAIADSTFDQSITSLELVENAPYQDWYESRNQNPSLLTLDETNIGGNTGKKAKLSGTSASNQNTYLTQDFLTPFNNTFSLQWDVYVDRILNISGSSDKAAIMLVGDNVPFSVNGPNYQATRNFAWLAFYKDGGAETGTVNLITTPNTGIETVLAPVTLDAWHNIRVEGNLLTDTYDVYLDNVLVGSGITARTNKTAITHISFAQWNDGAGTFYIDNVMEVTGPIVCVDADSDGYNVTGFTCGPVDCNDADPLINPLATEVCDGVDNNCAAGIDEGLTTIYYQDSDSDLFGNSLVTQNACSMPPGYVVDNTDCDDSNSAVNPTETEVCNGVDDNCDGFIDEDDVCGGGSGTLEDWMYRKTITIDHTKVSSDVTDFAVLIDLNDADVSSAAQIDGDDIVFTSSDGLTILSHEIESYDSGALVAWVKTDLSSSVDTVIYMYYGNPAATNQEDAENVWDNDYLAVHHLEEKIGMAIDSTSNDNDGTTDNGIDQDNAAFIDNGYALDGVNDKVTMPRVFTSQDEFTIEGWVNTGNKQGYVVSQRGTTGVFLQYFPGENNFQMFVNSLSIKVPGTTNDWHYVVGTYDGTTARLYVDAGTPASGVATLTWPDLQTLIGDRSTGSRAYLGSVDEIRLSDVARSASYIETSYNNQFDPVSFYGLSSEEILGSCTDGDTQQCGTTNVGECSFGIRTCSAGVWGSCVGNVEPVTEVCENGLDDDCDGVVDEGCGGSYGDWDYRKPITIANENVASSINGFPLLVAINDAELAASAQADGDDIFFTAADGSTKLSHEIENYDSGALIAWVKTDLSSSVDTVIYMYYGNPVATNQENAENVWDNDYLAVHHLEEKIGMAIDSTSNDNDGTADNGIDQDNAAFIDNGYAFDGTDDRVTMSQLFSGQNEFTFEAWVNTENKQGYVVSQRDLNSNGAFIQYYPVEGNFQMYVNSIAIKVPATTSTWHYVVGTYDGTTARLYVDSGTPATGNTNLIWPSLSTYVGDRAALNRAFQGNLDELRISDVARSDAYIIASYENQNNPGAFYNVGVQE